MNILNKLALEENFLLSLNIKDTEELKNHFDKEKLTIGDLFYHEKTGQYMVFFLKDVFTSNYYERGKFSGFCLYNLKTLINKQNPNKDYYILKENELKTIIDKNLSVNNSSLKDLTKTNIKLDYVGNILNLDSGIGSFFNQSDFYTLLNIIQSMKEKLDDLIFFYMKNGHMTSASYDNITKNMTIFSLLKKKLKKNQLQFSFLIERDIFIDSIMFPQGTTKRFLLTLNKYGLLDMITPHFYNGTYDAVNEILEKEDIKKGYDIYHSMYEDETIQRTYKENLIDFLYEIS